MNITSVDIKIKLVLKISPVNKMGTFDSENLETFLPSPFSTEKDPKTNPTLEGISGTKWKRTKFISSGGMANVYNVVSLVPGDKYPAQYIVKQGQNISNEIRIYTKMYKENTNLCLPTYIDSGIEEKTKMPFLILPKYNQPIPSEYHSIIPDSLFIGMVRNVLGGLKYIHDSGYCHNDIKPDNVLYNPYNECFVLLDFSVASKWNKEGNPDYTLKKFSGTKIYTGLDMHLEKKGPSPRSDIDSLVFTMLEWAGLKFSWKTLKSLDYIYQQKIRFLENPAVLVSECDSAIKQQIILSVINLNKLTAFSVTPDYNQLFNILSRAEKNIASCCSNCEKINDIMHRLLTNADVKKNRAAIAALQYVELV